MWRIDVGRVREIGDGARHPQDALHGAGGEPKPIDGAFEQFLVRVAQAAQLQRVRLAELGIEPAAAGDLADAGLLHPRAHLRAGLAGHRIRPQFAGWQPRYLHVQIDAIQQRTGNAAAIALDDIGRAAAAPAAIARPAAGIPITSTTMDERKNTINLYSDSILECP